jgi:hypothetical protein
VIVEAGDIKVWVIVFDDAKVEYLGSKGVTAADVDEVHGNRPRYFIWNPTRSLYDMIGPTGMDDSLSLASSKSLTLSFVS